MSDYANHIDYRTNEITGDRRTLIDVSKLCRFLIPSQSNDDKSDKPAEWQQWYCYVHSMKSICSCCLCCNGDQRSSDRGERQKWCSRLIYWEIISHTTTVCTSLSVTIIWTTWCISLKITGTNHWMYVYYLLNSINSRWLPQTADLKKWIQLSHLYNSDVVIAETDP